MKAVRIHECAGVHQPRYQECPRPALSQEDDVIVRVAAASLSRADFEFRAGAGGPSRSCPRIAGADGAGVVDAVSGGVRALRPGDPVCLFPFQECGNCRSCLRGDAARCSEPVLLGIRSDGTHAEYIRVRSRNCFRVPAGLSFEEAAALPVSYLMAWRMLRSDADLKPGEWVIIVGAGGGIATACLNLAVAVGARVVVLSRSAEKLDRARRCGAIHGITLAQDNPFQAARALTGKRGFDVAVNCVGGNTWSPALSALARGGRLVTCGALCGGTPQTDLRRVFWNHLTLRACRSATPEEFARVLEFFAAGKHKPVIDSVFALRDAHKAQARLESGEQFGKIILRIGDLG